MRKREFKRYRVERFEKKWRELGDCATLDEAQKLFDRELHQRTSRAEPRTVRIVDLETGTTLKENW